MSKTKRKKKKNYGFSLIAIIVVVELLVFFSGFGLGLFVGEKKSPEPLENKTEVSDKKKPAEEKKPEVKEESSSEGKKKETIGENNDVASVMENMTLSEKIYQMMYVTPESLTNMGQVVRAGDTSRAAIEKYPVGGIIYFSANFEDAEQTEEMISNMQTYSEIPLFIGVDEEGGRVSRLGDKEGMGVSKNPPMREIGNGGDPNKAYETGKKIGEEIKTLGFNMDFAPVADVVLNENNTEIGDRAFSTDFSVASSMVEQFVKGMEETGVSATIKHFPGHGSTTVDSHTGYSASERTIDELRQFEFQPFKAGIAAGADFVLVSHMTLVNAINEKLPASLSKEVITDMLIGELGYKGIILTDSLQMGAIVDEFTIAEAAVKVVEAGNDMILMPPDIQKYHDAILKACEEGRITEERINQSVEKILSLKMEKGMF